MSEPTPESPCIGVCALEPDMSQCRGCYRTIEEIAAWSRYSVEEKRAVLAKLPDRRKVRSACRPHEPG